MDKWEYIVQELPSYVPDAQVYLNNYGKDGWEVVSVIYNTEQCKTFAYLKRHYTFQTSFKITVNNQSTCDVKEQFDILRQLND